MLYYLLWGIIEGGGDSELKYICPNLTILTSVTWFSVSKHIIASTISKSLCIKETYKNLHFELCSIRPHLTVDKIKRTMNSTVSCSRYLNSVKAK